MAALVDLHARPLFSEDGRVDAELLAVQARDRGLDGLVVAASDAALDLGDVAELSRQTGVQLFIAVELNADCGALVCVPAAADAWFAEAAWRSLKVDGAPYPAAEVISAFAARGGAVIAVPPASGADSNWNVPAGAAAVVVLGAGSTQLHEAAARTAHRARVASVGASAAAPGEPLFGVAATLFSAAITDQQGLCEALRGARAWPAEIGAQAAAVRAPAPAAPKADRADPMRQADAAGKSGDTGKPAGEPHEGSTSGRPAPKPAPPPRQPPQQAKGRGRFDVPERPGDNRGNRLNRDEIMRALWQPARGDDAQPTYDPVALMYGVESRRQQKRRDYNDQDLDRQYNGNRARGPDPNVMAQPSYEEMRPDRQQIQVLFAPNEEKHDLEDSVALRFAMVGVRQSEDAGPRNGNDRGFRHRNGQHRNRRR